MKYKQNILIAMAFLVIIFNGISLVHTYPTTAKVTSENQLFQPLKVNKITTAQNTTVVLQHNVTILLIITNVDQSPVSDVSFTDKYNSNYFTVMNASDNAVKNSTTVAYTYNVIKPNQTVVFSTTINFSGNKTTTDILTAPGFIDGTNITFINSLHITSWIKSNSLQFTVVSAQGAVIMRPHGLFSFNFFAQETGLVAILLPIITIIFPILVILFFSRYWSAKKRMKMQE